MSHPYVNIQNGDTDRKRVLLYIVDRMNQEERRLERPMDAQERFRLLDAIILAHYYVDGQVQEIADFVGDSYFLAEKATKVSASVIIFCGVSFMGESAKILNPGKRVVMAD